jgi:U3 small nucleolar ribonucleoprotein protein IMP4
VCVRAVIINTHALQNMGTMPTQYPHLIFANFNTKLGERVQNILKALFPPNKETSKRVASFVNQNDFISFRYVQADPRLENG